MEGEAEVEEEERGTRDGTPVFFPNNHAVVVLVVASKDLAKNDN